MSRRFAIERRLSPQARREFDRYVRRFRPTIAEAVWFVRTRHRIRISRDAVYNYMRSLARPRRMGRMTSRTSRRILSQLTARLGAAELAMLATFATFLADREGRAALQRPRQRT